MFQEKTKHSAIELITRISVFILLMSDTKTTKLKRFASYNFIEDSRTKNLQFQINAFQMPLV